MVSEVSQNPMALRVLMNSGKQIMVLTFRNGDLSSDDKLSLALTAVRIFDYSKVKSINFVHEMWLSFKRFILRTLGGIARDTGTYVICLRDTTRCLVDIWSYHTSILRKHVILFINTKQMYTQKGMNKIAFSSRHFKCVILNEKFDVSIQTTGTFGPMGPIDNQSVFAQGIAQIEKATRSTSIRHRFNILRRIDVKSILTRWVLLSGSL